ncbi:flagellar hook-basal body complex protein FliE [Pleionea sediminis]|uniref:flagellar hook-basal body complex protein FliE n=1 Tax=Pleionea sediminis TaxID=2569479 RepID=UPI00118654C5|nr:flagellar hook-basal body complex protein FliE [Pleionea sediminis]
MTQITPDQILAQMRQLTQAAQSQTSNPVAGSANSSFTDAMSSALKTVNQYQMEASNAANSIERGDGGVSLVKAMIASQKSSVAFDAAVQVRNRVVSAYQDIMNMPL